MASERRRMARPVLSSIGTVVAKYWPSGEILMSLKSFFLRKLSRSTCACACAEAARAMATNAARIV
ncbi:MAG: hypothetical protein EOP91_10940 [Lysobacteraceae bacterium]|nr:MAG: hypothetical protein EOP91_10940 [Xanthomonadaceae bacterium]